MPADAMPAPRKYRRPRRPPPVTQDDAPTPKKWLITLIVLSLLLHAVVMLAFIFVGRHTPKWSELAREDKPPEVHLVLSPTPAADEAGFHPHRA